MAKLHWMVFIIAGLALTFSSWMIDREKLVLFFYAGFVFLLIGIAKFIYESKGEDKKETGEKQLRHSH